MFYKIVISGIIICIFFTGAVIATDYYVDCSRNTNGDGTFENPWNTIYSVNNFNFGKGDDVYFKVNTICKMPTRLYIKWDGSASDRAVIGAYYDKGRFGLNGNRRPILDGQDSVPSQWQALIQASAQSSESTGYITIRDLEVRNSGYNGIAVNLLDNIIIENNIVNRTYGGQGIVISRGSHSMVKNNLVTDASLGPSAGAGIEITNMFRRDGETRNISVINNIVTRSHEGIGFYKGASYSLIEGNTVYDCQTYCIYQAGYAHHNTIRNNKVYTSSAKNPSYIGIGIGCETHTCESNYYSAPGIVCSDYHLVYNNLIANFRNGIHLVVEPGCRDKNIYPINNRFYNNIIVDSEYNMNVLYASTGTEVRNTISYTSSSSYNHLRGAANSNVLLENNLFSDDRGVSGTNAASKAIYGNPILNKASGWNSINPGSINPDWFRPKEGSPSIDSGIDLGSVFREDFTGKTRPVGRAWDIGAFEFGTDNRCTTLGGRCCPIGQICSVTTVRADDCSECCKGTCYTPQDPTNNCNDQGGRCCPIGQICSVTTVRADDCSECCKGTCYVPEGGKRYSVKEAENRIAIDGDLREFQGTEWITVYEPNSRVAGRYSLMWDAEALYIAADVTDSELNAEHTIRDSTIWKDDGIELMFDTDFNRGALDTNDYKFFVNILNVHRDSRGTASGLMDAGWNIQYESSVRTTATGYMIEIRIPWNGWEVKPEPGTVWGFDLGLRDMDNQKVSDYSIWSNSDGGTPNSPDGWGEIMFIQEPKDYHPYDWNKNGVRDIDDALAFIRWWKGG